MDQVLREGGTILGTSVGTVDINEVVKRIDMLVRRRGGQDASGGVGRGGRGATMAQNTAGSAETARMPYASMHTLATTLPITVMFPTLPDTITLTPPPRASTCSS